MLFVVPYLTVSADRLLARLFLAVALMAAYETVFVATTGSTPGKVIAGTRVAALEYSEIAWPDAIKRGLLVAISSLLILAAPLIGLGGLLAGGGAALGGLTVVILAGGIFISVFAAPARRSFIDRLSGTLVVTRATPKPLPAVTVAQYSGRTQPDTSTSIRGWQLATFDQRRRARTGRLDDAPLLVLCLLAVVFASSIPSLNVAVWVALGLLWELSFVVDETWRIARRGGNGGHSRAGLAVVDLQTGEAPAVSRSLIRSMLVSLPLYVLPAGILASVVALKDHPSALVPMIIFGALMVGFLASVRLGSKRGLHDLAAGTAVVDLRSHLTDGGD